MEQTRPTPYMRYTLIAPIYQQLQALIIESISVHGVYVGNALTEKLIDQLATGTFVLSKLAYGAIDAGKGVAMADRPYWNNQEFIWYTEITSDKYNTHLII